MGSVGKSVMHLCTDTEYSVSALLVFRRKYICH